MTRFSHELHFRDLLRVLTPEPRCQLISRSIDPVYFVDTKTKKTTTDVTGRAQSAVCVYCNKQIVAWGKIKPAKNRLGPPPSARIVIEEHGVTCGEDWAWRTLAAFSTDVMMAENQVKVSAWMKKILKSASQLATDVEREIAKMFDMLPAPIGSEKANYIHLWIETMNWLRWEPFEHGDEQHPHSFAVTDWDAKAANGMVRIMRRGDFDERCDGSCCCGLIGPVGREAVGVAAYVYDFPAGGGLG